MSDFAVVLIAVGACAVASVIVLVISHFANVGIKREERRRREEFDERLRK